MEEKEILTRDEMNKLFMEYHNGNMNARDKLIIKNFGLVYKIANSYRNYGIDLEDLIEEGKIGLIKAVDLFDYQRDTAFSTYAFFWIKQFIHSFVERQSKSVHIPIDIYRLNRKINYLRSKMTNNLNHSVEDSEIANILGISVEKLKEIEMYNNIPISLNTMVFDDSIELGDLIEDKNVDIFEEVFKKMKKGEVLKILKNYLNNREFEIIYLRYGFGGKPKSFEEVSKIMKISRGRVKQIELSILQKIRHSDVAKLLCCYLNNDTYNLQYEDVSSSETISFQTIREYFMKFSVQEMDIILKELDKSDLDILGSIYNQRYRNISLDKDIVNEYKLLVVKIDKVLNKCKRKI